LANNRHAPALLGQVTLLEGLIVGDGVRVFDVPHDVEHELDAVLTQALTRGAAERIVVHGRVQALVQVEHGEVAEDDITVRAVVDARIHDGGLGRGRHLEQRERVNH
jgi:hypothetical protein